MDDFYFFGYLTISSIGKIAFLGPFSNTIKNQQSNKCNSKTTFRIAIRLLIKELD